MDIGRSSQNDILTHAKIGRTGFEGYQELRAVDKKGKRKHERMKRENKCKDKKHLNRQNHGHQKEPTTKRNQKGQHTIMKRAVSHSNLRVKKTFSGPARRAQARFGFCCCLGILEK